MTNSTCATTVHAIRDTELACLPVGLLNTIKVKQPRVVSRLIQVLGEKILGTYNRVSLPLTTVSTTMVTAGNGGAFVALFLKLWIVIRTAFSL